MADITAIEGFSLTHAGILDGTTGAEITDGDIYGIRSGSLELDTASYDNTGDDAVLSTWYWFNFANVTVEAGYLSFKLMAILSGSTVSSSGAAPGDYYKQVLWDEDALNTSPHPMVIRIPSKDKLGVVRNLSIVLYRVQFSPFSFAGPSYKNGLLLNYSGRAVRSSVDEKAGSLAKAAIGRLISQPSGSTTLY